MTKISPEFPKTYSSPLVPVLAIIGVGLIGGSFAAALRQAGQVGRIFGVERKTGSLERFQELGLIDDIVRIEIAASQADLILFATPIGSLEILCKKVCPHLKKGSILTDVSSTKMQVMEMAQRVFGDKVEYFVPGHPIAGNEHSGADFSNANLFKKRHVILTPFKKNKPETVNFIRSVWKACGANVLDMTAEKHDQMLASISHVPHFLSAAYMAQVIQTPDANERLAIAGSGFRDFTRIAAGSDEIWTDIFLSNREFVAKEIGAVKRVLEEAEKALDAGDYSAIKTFLKRASKARKHWSQE